jgi:outer membrane lipoprotein-sorting protein
MEMLKFAPMRILALLLLPVISIAQTHNEAKELLNKVYEKTLSLETQQISFTNTIEAPSNGETKKRSSKGELYALGEKVRIKTGAFEFLSDGKNAYLIYPEDEEIEKTVSGEETSLSPSDILKNYQSGYSYKLAGKATENGKQIQYVVLKPVASEEIKEIMIGIDTHSMLLENYIQFGTNGINTTFSVTKYEVNITLDSDLFNINSNEFKGYYRL